MNPSIRVPTPYGIPVVAEEPVTSITCGEYTFVVATSVSSNCEDGVTLVQDRVELLCRPKAIITVEINGWFAC